MASTKKDNELKLDIPMEGVKTKLQVARVMLQKENLTKTGKNDFAHFDFFQLEDFLPQINEIFAKLGLHSEFNITTEVVAYEEKSTVAVESGDLICITKTPILKEMATLVITDVLKPDDVEVYEMEVAPVQIGNNTKQNISTVKKSRQKVSNPSFKVIKRPNNPVKPANTIEICK